MVLEKRLGKMIDQSVKKPNMIMGGGGSIAPTTGAEGVT